MIYIVAVFFGVQGPLLTMRSMDGFETVAACEAALAADRPGFEMIRADVAARTGSSVGLDLRCAEIGASEERDA